MKRLAHRRPPGNRLLPAPADPPSGTGSPGTSVQHVAPLGQEQGRESASLHTRPLPRDRSAPAPPPPSSTSTPPSWSGRPRLMSRSTHSPCGDTSNSLYRRILRNSSANKQLRHIPLPQLFVSAETTGFGFNESSSYGHRNSRYRHPRRPARPNLRPHTRHGPPEVIDLRIHRRRRCQKADCGSVPSVTSFALYKLSNDARHTDPPGHRHAQQRQAQASQLRLVSSISKTSPSPHRILSHTLIRQVASTRAESSSRIGISVIDLPQHSESGRPTP